MLEKIITSYHETLGRGNQVSATQTALGSSIGALTVVGIIVTLVFVLILIVYTARKDLEKTNSKKK